MGKSKRGVGKSNGIQALTCRFAVRGDGSDKQAASRGSGCSGNSTILLLCYWESAWKPSPRGT